MLRFFLFSVTLNLFQGPPYQMTGQPRRNKFSVTRIWELCISPIFLYNSSSNYGWFPMPLSADTLIDRMQLKRQLTRWRLIAVATVVLSLLFIVEMTTETRHKGTGLRQDFIARLNIEGVIMDDPDRDQLLADIQENKHAKALIVRIDSPGGSAIGGQELYLKLKEIAKDKPVVAVMRSIAASAAYMTALGADRIYAREGTITGSIGVLIQTAEFTGLAEKLGITPITVKSAPLKASPSPLEKYKPEDAVPLQNMIDDFFGYFVGLVQERRGLTHEAALKVSDGRIFSGMEATKLKLVDQLGGEDEAVQWLREQKGISPSLDVREVKVEKEDSGLIEKLVDSAATKVLPEGIAGLDGLVAIWHPAVQLQ